MDWAWLFEQGWIEGDLAKYENNELNASDIAHAIKTAYLAIDSDADRKRFVDMVWANGLDMQGDKTYWYTARPDQVNDLANAYSGHTGPAPEAGVLGDPNSDFTDEATTRFNGLPGKPEIWINEDTGEVYAVFFPDGMQPPVPLLFHIPNEEVLQSYFGDQPFAYDKRFNSAGLMSTGAVVWGDVADLKDVTGDPWAGFTEKMDRAAEVMPWLEDPEVFAVIAGAYLEGRPVEEWELATTNWYRTHNEAERAWLTKVAQDPASAEDEIEDNIRTVYDEFVAMGIENIDMGTVEYIARRWTEGTWSKSYRDEQILAVTGSRPESSIDSGLADAMSGDPANAMGQATVGLDQVAEMYRRWLGPMFAPDEATLREWAGKFREDPEGAQALLTESLRAQRLALFPEYTDPTLTYDDIAGPWKSMAYNTWGVMAQDTDAEFQDVIRMNNASDAAVALRRIGAERGYEQVTRSMMNDLESSFRRNVRGAV